MLILIYLVSEYFNNTSVVKVYKSIIEDEKNNKKGLKNKKEIEVEKDIETKKVVRNKKEVDIKTTVREAEKNSDKKIKINKL